MNNNLLQTTAIVLAAASAVPIIAPFVADAAETATKLNLESQREVFADNGYRARGDTQRTLDKIWEMGGNHQLRHSNKKINGGNVDRPDLISIVESALGVSGQYNNMKYANDNDKKLSTDLAKTLSKDELKSALQYLRVITHDMLQDGGLENAGRYNSGLNLEGAGQVKTGSNINPLTPTKNGEYYKVTKGEISTHKGKARMEWNLRNRYNADGELDQNANNAAVDMAKRESSLNPFEDTFRHQGMFQLGVLPEAAAHNQGRGGLGDWWGQTEAFESLARSNLKSLYTKLPDLDTEERRKILFTVHDKPFYVIATNEMLQAMAHITGAPNTWKILNNPFVYINPDALGTNAKEYLLAAGSLGSGFKGEKGQAVAITPAPKSPPVIPDITTQKPDAINTIRLWLNLLLGPETKNKINELYKEYGVDTPFPSSQKPKEISQSEMLPSQGHFVAYVDEGEDGKELTKLAFERNNTWQEKAAKTIEESNSPTRHC